MIQPVDSTYFNALFPSLSGADPAQIAALMPVALISVDEGAFGANARYACALVIAHNVQLDLLKGAGAATSKSTGRVSISHAAGSQQDVWDATTYGKRFKDLCRQLSVPAKFVAPGGASLPEPFNF